VGTYLTHRLGEGPARATVRYEVAVLNAAFSVAVDNGQLAMRPMFKLPAVHNARFGFFEDRDLAALLLELPADVRPVIQFASLTGWRKSEVLGLTWESVDWEGYVIRLRAMDTKVRTRGSSRSGSRQTSRRSSRRGGRLGTGCSSFIVTARAHPQLSARVRESVQKSGA
jgi:integrase